MLYDILELYHKFITTEFYEHNCHTKISIDTHNCDANKLCTLLEHPSVS